MLLHGGFAGIGFMAYRRKSKAAPGRNRASPNPLL